MVSRRNTELGLLVLVTLVIAGAYTLMSLAEDSQHSHNVLVFLGIIVGLQLTGHFALRRLAPEADPVLLPVVSFLNGLGYVFIVRLDEDLVDLKQLWTLDGLGDFLGSNAGLQALWTLLGMVCFVATLVFVKETRKLEAYRYTAGLVGIVLLLLPLVPGLGRQVNGSRIWVSFGPINLQPGEFAKLLLAVFFAAYLYEKRELLALTRTVGPLQLPEPRHAGPLVLAWGAAMVVMVFETDIGTALLFFALFVVLVWVATGRTFYLVASTLMFIGGAWAVLSMFPHAGTRFEQWGGFGADLVSSPGERPEQLDLAAFAMGDGGLLGTGLNLGRPDLVPEVETDFIFAAITEELGLVGATAVLISFLIIIGTGLRIAQQQTASGFDRLFTVGLTTLIGVQAFIITAGVTRLLPLTGVTLPFVSYGGSSLLANYAVIALLLRMSDTTARQRDQEVAAHDMTTASPALGVG